MMLVIGYGNPGRCDDGLGPAFAERLAGRGVPGVTVLSAYQLTVEHALKLTEAETVLFADAEMGLAEPFHLRELPPATGGDVTSHALSPAALLALTETLYGKAPRAFVLGLAGAEFGRVHEGLSDVALRNLDLAEVHVLEWLKSVRQPAANAGEARTPQPHSVLQ